MANRTDGSIVYIDTFGADVTVATGPVRINAVVIEGASAGDTAIFNDADGNAVLRISSTANAGSLIFAPAEPQYFPNGLTLASGSDFSSGDYVQVYLM